MLIEDKYFKSMTRNELWKRYCGFLDLPVEQFMAIQNELLKDEIDRVADSILGKKIMGNRKPTTIKEFRETVPLTTYEDYEPYLSDKNVEALAIKPLVWCHSAGRGGKFKWLPHSSEFMDNAIKTGLGTFILASAREKGEVNIEPGMKFLTVLPPATYASGCFFNTLLQRFSIRLFPPLSQEASMDLEGRIKKGFEMGLKEGVDAIGSLASILVAMGRAFGGQNRSMKFSSSMLTPGVLYRLTQAMLKSKREKRGLLPKDLWPSKAIMAGGLDTAIYRDEIEHLWGRKPYEAYACA